MLRRWLVALAALVVGGGTSAAVIAFGNPDAGSEDVYVAVRDLPLGSPIRADSVRLQRMRLGAGAPLAFSAARAATLFSSRAGHDLASGQLIQSSDLVSNRAGADARLVFVPMHDIPLLAPGDRVDFLTVTGPVDHMTVAPFLLGVEVRSQTPAGIVVSVTSEQASALLFAVAAVHLTAVVASPGTAPGAEGAVSDLEAARQAARR